MLKVYNVNLKSLFVGGDGIQSAYVGSTQVFNAIPSYNIILDYEIPEGAGGSISGGGTFKEGETITVIATPQEGSRFVGWYVNGTVVSTNESYTFTVTGDMTLIAVFEVHVKQLVYHGQISPFTSKVSAFGAASTDTYAMFGGGYSSSAATATVALVVYDINLTRTYKGALAARWVENGGAGTPTKAFFAGGRTGKGTPYTPAVESIDNTLTKTKLTNMAKYRTCAGSSIENKALFAGGYVYQSSSSKGTTNIVEVYDDAGTKTTVDSLTSYRYDLRGATLGNYVIYGGGRLSSGNSSDVDIYDNNLTHTTPSTKMTTAKYSYGAAAVGDYCLFAGGSSGTASASQLKTIDVYNKNLVHSTLSKQLATGRQICGSVFLDGFAIFAGGYTLIGSTSKSYTLVEAFDKELTYLTPAALPSTQDNYGATVGNYALFPNGTNNVVYTYAVE